MSSGVSIQPPSEKDSIVSMNMSLSVAVVPGPDIFTQTVAANVELCQPAGWRSPLDNLKAVIGERTPHATQSFLVMTGQDIERLCQLPCRRETQERGLSQQASPFGKPGINCESLMAKFIQRAGKTREIDSRHAQTYFCGFP
ncbi:hypothetical protein A2G95_20285 [Klebsiella quasipneumoniae subsp. similipneumoniae]|nr:hypothetical protein A2G95_20285 [Klebsiella quasipneumoniae subsp. similipneumoniae]